MSESSDSPEVQAFMAAFQKLRNLVDDTPELIVSKARESNSLQSLCHDVLEAAFELRKKEHSRRELYSSPTSPAFLAAWLNYNSKYSEAVGQVAYIVSQMPDEIFGPALDEKSRDAVWKEYEAVDWRGAEQRFRETPWEWYWAGVEKSLETRWRESDEIARAHASAIDQVIEEAKISIDASVGDGITEEYYQDRVLSGIDAWKRLVGEVGFDLAGVFRRRKLVPFVMIPRHVSGHYGGSDPLSLMARLQQAQEAFVYGVPLAAFALMRVVLDLVLTNHYAATGKDLNEKIDCSKDNLPGAIHWTQLQKLKRLGNDAVHIKPKELHKINEQEREIVALLAILQRLIELAPQAPSRQ